MKVTHALVVVIACALLPIIAPLPSVVCVYVLLVVSFAVQLLLIKRWRHTRQWNDSHSLSILCLLAMQCSLCHLAYIDWIQLPDDWTPTKVTLTAEVMSLPKQVDYDQYSVQQFVARVVSIEQPLNATRMPASHVSVNWYNHDTNVKVGERWAFTLTIKNPRSLANEGAFNYRLWLLSQGITATGNVVNAERLASAESVWTINGLRERFRDKLLSYADVTQQDLILAVSIGDRSLMSHERWASFSDTGTSHLVAISGLHIGLFSALLYWLIKGLLIVWRTPLRYLPNTSWAAIMSLIFTGMYVLLSGMAIPAQRAFIMLVCLLGAQIVRLQIPMNVRMLVALLLIVLINPLSVFLDGLYLSFLCVLVLTLSLSGNLKSPTAWRTAGASQLYLFWLLFPLSVYCFQTFSWQSPWVNLFAIPFFGVFVLPLIILFTVSWGVSVYVPSFEWATDFTLSCLNLGLERFSEAIAWCQSLNEVFSSPQILSMDTHRLLLLLGLSLLIALSTFKRWLLLYGVIVLAALFPNTLQPRADVEMVVFDVGQGLSVLFRTQHHTLLYDVGGRFASGFNMAQGVILPFLSRHNIDSIDALVVSHNDNDHAGALSDLVSSVPVKRLLVGDKRTLKRVNPERAEQCEHQSWEWDGVSFQIVYSRPDAPASNDRSCVLLVTWGSQRVMLTGDISKRAERDILNTYTAEQLRSNVLIAPHHGSNTSSSPSFVNTVHPQHVVFSVGYQHRFGHPHKPVVQRYQTTNSRLWRTDRHGAISFAWDADKTLTTRSHTEGIQRFWNRSHASLHTD